MSDPAEKPISRGILISFILYFAALLPGLVWGLWSLVSENTFVVPGSAPAVTGPFASAADSLAALSLAQELRDTRLVLAQGELFLAVMLSGALGSYIHGVNSFVSYVGNRRFLASWAPWYFLRPFMGVAMAVVFYVAVRGGVLVLSGGNGQVDPYGMMTVAALAGMFSKQASDKLAEVFDTLFRSRGDDERRDKLQNPVPKLTALDPAKVAAGAGDTTIALRGEGFVPESVVRFAGEDRQPTARTATGLTVQLRASDLAKPGEHAVTVFNPAPGGGASNVLTLVVSTELVPAPPLFGGEEAGGDGEGEVPVAPGVEGEGEGGGGEEDRGPRV